LGTLQMVNFTLRDTLVVCVACLIFPAVLVFPGYVLGRLVNLFDFRARKMIARYAIAILASLAFTPILFFLLAFFISFRAVEIVVISIFIVYVFTVLVEARQPNLGWVGGVSIRYQRFAFLVAAIWVALSILSLVDLQWGDRLYNNYVSLDFATRATVVNAITRTGVPPVNPSYFPGKPAFITSLYYFWYILCSVVERLGGDLVDARMSLIAGDIWCGLALMALITFYIKLRNHVTGESAWKMALVGISLLAVSGLDFVPALGNMLENRFSYGFIWPPGDIEHWNEQITAWTGSIFWVPHHVAAMVTCLTGFMILQYYRGRSIKTSIPAMAVAGLAFASAAGLSIWVTITFAVFLGVWLVILFTQRTDRELIMGIILTGIVAVLAASPFLIGVLQGGTGASGLPVTLAVRRYLPAAPIVAGLPNFFMNLVYILVLPINYWMELGFFFVVGVLWLRQYGKKDRPENPFFIPEMLLLLVVLLVCSFVRSVIAANDLGWRGWLFGQFILLIWAVDLYGVFPFLLKFRSIQKPGPSAPKAHIANLLTFLWLMGVITSVVDLTLLRLWPILIDMNVTGFPNGLSADTQLGFRTFDARLAYEFVDNRLPMDIVIQQNPVSEIYRIDRPSGLYGNRQFAVSFSAPYNVPIPVLKTKVDQVAGIFQLDHETSWDRIDQLCRDHFIDVLVVSDQDALWTRLPVLDLQRTALYKNRYYAVFACGNFVSLADHP